MTTAIALHTIDNEPRVLDTDLAERLGMKNPRNIRPDLIQPHTVELMSYGELQALTANTGKRGPKPKVYYLNEEQALLICMFSKTDNAALARKQVIESFMAHRRGQLAPVTQANGDERLKRCAERLTVWTARAREYAVPTH